MKDRSHTLNIGVVLVVIIYSISIQSLLERLVDSIIFSYLINLITSIISYEIILKLIYSFINNMDFFLKIYWKKLYLKGIWSYTYTLENIEYKGIWRIDQDLYGVKVRGFGIDKDGKPRSDVRSVTDLIERTQCYEIINIRRDRVQIEIENYSKTTLYPEISKRNLFSFSYPHRIRATTIIYGGPLSGRIHKDIILIKHENARSENDVLNALITKS